MMQYKITNGYIHIFLNEREKVYNISLDELGQTIPNSLNGFQYVSRWIYHLGTTRGLSKTYLLELAELIKKLSPDNKIDWSKTFEALN